MNTIIKSLTEHDAFRPTEGITNVDPDLARTWLRDHKYEKQRKIRPYHVKNLANEMIANRFMEKTAIHFCYFDGRFYLVNGQHTLSAIVLSEQSVNLIVVVYPCTTWTQVADYFARFDTHLTRQMSDSLYAHEIDRHFGVTKTQLSWITAAAIYYAYMTNEISSKAATQITHDEKLSLVMKHGDAINDALKISDGFHNVTWVVRKTSLACTRILNDFDQAAAREFWRCTIEDDGLRRGDPRKALVELFRSAVTIGGGWGSYAGRKTMTDPQWVKAISLAWNAFIDGRDLVILKTAGALKSKEVEFSLIGKFRV